VRVYTIGHSTRSLDELVRLLRESAVKRLADIRRFPGSKRHPHFSREALSKSIPDHGLDYVHIEALGGHRKELPNSPNTALRNGSFRAYADYMATPAFRTALDALLESDQTTAIMCAEAVPWRCHRNFVSDELVRRGHEVVHILNFGSRKKHEISPFARDTGDHLEYR
jgi:uncharacterized protein (DUF488 family)